MSYITMNSPQPQRTDCLAKGTLLTNTNEHPQEAVGKADYKIY